MNDEEAACTPPDKQNNTGGALLQAAANPPRCNSSSNYSASGSCTEREGSGLDEEANTLLRDALDGSSSDVTAMLVYTTTKVGLAIYNVMILCSSVIPITVLFALTIGVFAGRIKEYSANTEIHKALLFSMQASDAVHALQQERDMTAFFIGTYSAITKADLVEQYRKTDATLHMLSDWPVASREEQTHFLSKDDFLTYLNHHRYQLSLSNTSEKIELATYSAMISQMMNWFTDAVRRDKTKGTWKELVALQQVIDAKNAFGIERAYGAIFFSSGGFESKEDYHTFARNQAIANSSIKSAIEYSDVVRKMHLRYTQMVGALTGSLRDMRHEIRDYDPVSKDRRQPSSSKALAWFGNMTIYVDALFDIQSSMKDRISLTMYNMYKADLLAIAGFGVFLFAALPMCSHVAKSIYAVSQQIPKFHVLLRDCVLFRKKEKDRIQKLVESHEPTNIAEHLKQTNKMGLVLPHITIVAIQIVGLPNITGAIVGKQVANAVRVIDLQASCLSQQYDVFRKDRGCDSLLFVSGTSPLQRECHASAACSFALDLITECGQLPVITDLRLKFRIALHSVDGIGFIVDKNDVPVYDILSQAIPISQRMLCFSRPDTVILSELTRDMATIDKAFECPVVRTNIASQKPYGDTFWLRENNASMPPSSNGSMTSIGRSSCRSRQYESILGLPDQVNRSEVVAICVNAPSDAGDSAEAGSSVSDTRPESDDRGDHDTPAKEELDETTNDCVSVVTGGHPTTAADQSWKQYGSTEQDSTLGDWPVGHADGEVPGQERARSPSRHGTNYPEPTDGEHGSSSSGRSGSNQSQCGSRAPSGVTSQRSLPSIRSPEGLRSRSPSPARSACGSRRQSEVPDGYGIRPPSISPTGCVSRPPSRADSILDEISPDNGFILN